MKLNQNEIAFFNINLQIQFQSAICSLEFNKKNDLINELQNAEIGYKKYHIKLFYSFHFFLIYAILQVRLKVSSWVWFSSIFFKFRFLVIN